MAPRARTTWLAGVNNTLPVASGALMVKVWPAQALPAMPEPVALSATTPVSGIVQGARTWAPQVGHRAIWLSVTLPAAWAPVLLFVTWIVAGTPVSPTVREPGAVESTLSTTAGERRRRR